MKVFSVIWLLAISFMLFAPGVLAIESHLSEKSCCAHSCCCDFTSDSESESSEHDCSCSLEGRTVYSVNVFFITPSAELEPEVGDGDIETPYLFSYKSFFPDLYIQPPQYS